MKQHQQKIKNEIETINNSLRSGNSKDINSLLKKRAELINSVAPNTGTFPCSAIPIPLPQTFGGTGTESTLGGALVNENAPQELTNKIINGNCNSITNITVTISGVLPIISGGTGLSLIALDGVLIGNNSSTPTVQTISGNIVDTSSIQTFINKIIDASLNPIIISTGQLTDVSETTLVDGDILIYNTSSNAFINNTLVSGTGISIVNSPGVITINSFGDGASYYWVGILENGVQGYTTIGAAIAAAVIAGASNTNRKTIIIAPGTYTENIVVSDGIDLTCFTNNGSNNNNTAMITSNIGVPVILEGSVTLTNITVTGIGFNSVMVNDVPNININLTNVNLYGSGGYGFYVNNTNNINVTIQNVQISNDNGLFINTVNQSNFGGYLLNINGGLIFTNVTGNFFNCNIGSSTPIVLTNSSINQEFGSWQGNVLLNNNTTLLIFSVGIIVGSGVPITIDGSSTLISFSSVYGRFSGVGFLIDGTGTWQSHGSFVYPGSNSTTFNSSTLNYTTQGDLGLNDGQIMIGQTGGESVATTLSVGSNINITNGVGSITISALGPFSDSIPLIMDNNDNTKQAILSATLIPTGITNTYILPNNGGSSVFVDNTTSQTLTNKVLDSNTNVIGATQLMTTGADVIINTADPPTGAGQVLMTTSTTSATWQPALSLSWNNFSAVLGDGTNNFTLGNNECSYFMLASNMLFFSIHVDWSSKGSAAGNFQITVPWTASNGGGINATRWPITLGNTISGIIITGGYQIGAGMNGGGNIITLEEYISGSSSTVLSCGTSFMTTGELQLSGWILSV
jgi:hypothetical protein